jgi:hypothetical protein
LQSCTYVFDNRARLKIVSVDSNGRPSPITINTDVISKSFSPNEDGFIYADITYKLPLISLSGKNIHKNITNLSTVSFVLDSQQLMLDTQFYLENNTISLTGTVPATNNLYFIDYYGKGFLKNGKLSLKLTKGIYTIFFPRYFKTFLIENGHIENFSSHKWSIKLYMDDGDNPVDSDLSFSNLKPYLLEDLSEIKHNYYFPTYSAILAYADFIGTEHHTYKFLRDQRFEVNSDLTDDSYSWKNLKNFITIKDNSRYKALFLWDHGNSWAYYDNSKALFVDGPNIMNLTDLASALSDDYFDILAFDMCLMGSVEVLYQIRNYANYVVFSEGPIPSDGFDYENLLCGNYDPEDFATYLCERFDSFYKGDYVLTGINSLNSQSFFNELNELSDSLTDFASSDRNFVDYIQSFIPKLYKTDLYYGYQVDLIQMLNKIYSYPKISENILCNIRLLKSYLSNMCISKSENIGIAFVKEDGSFDFLNYDHNSFAKTQHWIYFLKILSERMKNDYS